MTTSITDVKTYVINNEISYFRFKHGSLDYKLEGVIPIANDGIVSFCLLRDNIPLRLNQDGTSSPIIYTLEQIQQTGFWQRLEKAFNLVVKLNELENLASKVQLVAHNIDVPIHHLFILLTSLKGKILKTLNGLSTDDIDHLNRWKWHLDTLAEYFELLRTQPNPEMYIWIEPHAEKIKSLGQVAERRSNKL